MRSGTLPFVEGGSDVGSDGLTLESSILSDMERIQLELRRIETSGLASLEELVESKRATKQERFLIWFCTGGS